MAEILIVGFGNLGRGVVKALEITEDMTLGGIFTRRPKEVRKEVDFVPVMDMRDAYLLKDNSDAVAILCGGSGDLETQMPFFTEMVPAVCSYDSHPDIGIYFQKVNLSAKKGKNTAIISAGWDPGLFSIIRILFDALLPRGTTYTFWGEGVSQGHSNEARKVKGVIDARQYTVPIKGAIDRVRRGELPYLAPREMHKRIVYVVAKGDYDRIRDEIAFIPGYYEPYETEVIFISKEEMERDHSSLPHGGFVLRSGLTGENKQLLEFSLALESNPEFTASVLVACARAALKMKKEGKTGAFTMVDAVPYLSPRSWENLLENRFV